MQRRRSYVEAMEDGSFHEQLLVGNNLESATGSSNEKKYITMDKKANNNAKESAEDSDWSNDSVFENPVEELECSDVRSKSQDFDMFSSLDRNTVISLKRDFVSENDVNSIDVVAQAIMDYKKTSEVSDTSNASRGLSVVEELIGEPLNTGKYNHLSRKSLQKALQNESESKSNDQRFSDNFKDERQRYSAPLETILPFKNDPAENEVVNNQYSEDEPHFYEEGELNYDSDDMILDLDEPDAERGRMNSLTIPNTVTSDENTVLPILYTGRNSVRKSRRRPENCGNRSRRVRRLIFKNGETNIPLRQHIPSKFGKFMKDIVTTLIECQWRWITLIFSMGHFLLWLIFGLMFYVASYSNGDLSDDPPKIPCIENGRTFTGIFGFSVETQVSIGYGEKSPTEECPEVIFILVMEVIAGNALLGALVGIVYAKIARPEKKVEGVGFSKHAVICMRDGQLCLVVRVWDTQGKHVIGTRVSAYLINHNVPCSTPLVLEQQNPLIMWPTTMQHNIVEGSPLYDTSAKDLLDQRFEIVFSITGSSRTTGQASQTRTSFLPHNILWGQRFINILSYDKDQGCYVADQKSLNAVRAVDTPLCSARLLHQVTEQGPSSPFFISTPSSPSSLTSPGWSFRRAYRPTVIRRPHNNTGSLEEE